MWTSNILLKRKTFLCIFICRLPLYDSPSFIESVTRRPNTKKRAHASLDTARFLELLFRLESILILNESVMCNTWISVITCAIRKCDLLLVFYVCNNCAICLHFHRFYINIIWILFFILRAIIKMRNIWYQFHWI